MFSLITKLNVLKDAISFAIMETKWKDHSKYGLWSESASFDKPADVTDSKNLYLEPFTRMKAGLRLISYQGRFIVRKYSVCAANLTVVTGNHIPTVGIPEYYLGVTHINDKESDIIIEEAAWIGVNVTLIQGAHIGRGAVIGACSLVNSDIPPYAVAVGVPAKVIATTFTLDQALLHEKLLFKENERIPSEQLTSLFENQYKELRAIGMSDVPIDHQDLKNAIYDKVSQIRDINHYIKE